ncbi:MAG: monofunctional biosynthetic peptidoglycan transglycosylase, partial [Cyclobacteriaceae bacterium]|nr:monofunctional biosynthetic peptidoglycan transglycosylase [Cyclobacteriaceae bacterium]
MALSPRVKKILRKIRNLFLILFILQLVYIIALKWIDPPVTLTQLGSWFQGSGLKRDYVSRNEMSTYAGLAVMASE